jgi:hypothetical protein
MRVLRLANEIEVIAKSGKDDGTLSLLFDELQTVYAAAAMELKQHL